MQKNLEREKEERERDIKALKKELGPLCQETTLFRKGIYENRLKLSSQHAQEIIDARNQATHGGNVATDLKMLEGMSQGREAAVTKLHERTFNNLYGVRSRDVAFMSDDDEDDPHP